MPKINIHYTFTKEAFIDTIVYIRFQNKDARFWEGRVGGGVYKGVVEAVYVENKIAVDVLVYGVEGAKWTLEVKAKKVELQDDGSYEEVDPEYKLNGSPISGEIDGGGISQYDKAHTFKEVEAKG